MPITIDAPPPAYAFLHIAEYRIADAINPTSWL